jgi:LysW-gamma-L-lysine carboxypeptidase
VLKKLKDMVEKTANEKSIKASFRIEDKTEPFEANRSSPIVRALSLSILDICKKRANLIRKTGTGDMNVLGTTFNVPVVTYGPGESHASHTPDEHVKISQYISSIDVIGRALVHLSRLHNNPKDQITS